MKQSYKFLVLFVIIVIVTVSSIFAIQTSSPSSINHSENMKGLGHVTLTLYGADGSMKAYRQTDNLIVNNGDNATVNKMFNVARTTTFTVGIFNAVAVGTGTTLPTTAEIALSNQVGHKIIGTTSIAKATHGNVILTAIFNPGKITNSSVSITEAGIFDNTAANLQLNNTNMFARQNFNAINVGSADTLKIVWTIDIT